VAKSVKYPWQNPLSIHGKIRRVSVNDMAKPVKYPWQNPLCIRGKIRE